jgi:hypothetical protein
MTQVKEQDLLQYLRKKRAGQNAKIGILVAKKVKNKKGKNKVLVGWSKCKLTADVFDKEIGMQIAEGRIASRVAKGKKAKEKVPPSIKPQLDAFVERCKLYFKTTEVKVT